MLYIRNSNQGKKKEEEYTVSMIGLYLATSGDDRESPKGLAGSWPLPLCSSMEGNEEKFGCGEVFPIH